ncbi:VWA domain-containing protein [Gracilibacillus caseinilyticus]|uniref:VWA domain-containing protein n=1 Tax=Gracilibacillus caseinilyticus TaxID=2932256 RepID=A0ABY4EZZ1_9BACI|nr:VWA domain-containing protein [Gracilibacillus caseinilyticus]UOQ49428.1 VWA domain-containing protein [Gracilibacillus caseinilyticus]
MRKYMMIFLLTFITIGCSDEETKQTDDVVDTNKEEENAAQQDNEIDSRLSEISIKIDEGVIKQLAAGELTGNLSFEKETERTEWGMEELDPAFLNDLVEAMQSNLTDTDEPETLLKGLIYYAGSPYHSELLSELEGYQPNFQEPLLPRPDKVEEEENKASEYAYLLLDASSSMLMEAEDGSGQRMATAKDAVESFAKTIGESTEVSLVAFGHKGDDSDAGKEKSCSGIEEVSPLGNYEGEKFHEAVSSIDAKGWTPLAAGIDKIMQLSAEQEGNVTVYIVSDGVETCDSNPIEAAESFVNNSNEDRTVNIIGFQVDQEAEEQLIAVAEAGNGEYFAANNGEELESAIEYEWLPSLIDLAYAPVNLAPVGWEILHKKEDISDISSNWKAVISREDHRFRSVVDSLEDEGWLAEDKASQLKDLLEERKQGLDDINSTLRDEKKAMVDKEANEIKAEVEAWMEEMRQLREQASS